MGDGSTYKAQQALELLSSLYGSAESALSHFPDLALTHPSPDDDESACADSPPISPLELIHSFDFDTASPPAIAAYLKSDTHAEYLFVDWTKTSGPKKAFAILHLNSDPHIVRVALSAINLWLSEHKGGEATAKKLLAFIEHLDTQAIFPIAHVVTYALKSISTAKRRPSRTRILTQIARCIQILSTAKVTRPDARDDPIRDAINSDPFRLTEALFALLPDRTPPKRGTRRRDALSLIKKMLLASTLQRARVALGLGFHFAYMHKLDREWAESFLVPLLSDTNCTVCRYTWCGFLWNARFDAGLVIHLKKNLIRGIDCTKDISDVRSNLGMLPVFLHYYYPSEFGTSNLRDALTCLDIDTLAASIQGICRLLPEEDDSHRAWEQWIRDAIQDGLPSENRCYGEQTSIAFVELVVALEGIAEQVVAVIWEYLAVTRNLDRAIYRLVEKSGFVERHSKTSLCLVRRLAPNELPPSAQYYLRRFLDELSEANPFLTTGEDFRYLSELME